MTLSIDARLGPYEILSALGAGGMGEVYRTCYEVRSRCRDQSPAHFLTSDVGSRASRAKRRCSPRCTHPNIAAIHHVEAQDISRRS